MAEEPSAAVRELEEDELEEDGALPANPLLDHLKLCAILHEAHDAPPRDPDTSSQVHATSADALPRWWTGPLQLRRLCLGLLSRIWLRVARPTWQKPLEEVHEQALPPPGRRLLPQPPEKCMLKHGLAPQSGGRRLLPQPPQKCMLKRASTSVSRSSSPAPAFGEVASGVHVEVVRGSSSG